MGTKFNSTIDKIQAGLVWFVIVTIAVCISVLFLFDVLAGTGTMLYLTNGKEWQSVLISLATTGLLFALMFLGFAMSQEKNSQILQVVGKVVGGLSLVIYVQDIIFDALLADILRYGTVVLGSVDALQWMFRVIMGGISTVGDALALAMILGLPVLKTVIGKALGNATTSTNQTVVQPKYNVPSSIPRQGAYNTKNVTYSTTSGRKVYNDMDEG